MAAASLTVFLYFSALLMSRLETALSVTLWFAVFDKTMMINVGVTLHAFVERKLLPQHLMMVSEGENVNTRGVRENFFEKDKKNKKHNTRTRACLQGLSQRTCTGPRCER